MESSVVRVPSVWGKCPLHSERTQPVCRAGWGWSAGQGGHTECRDPGFALTVLESPAVCSVRRGRGMISVSGSSARWVGEPKAGGQSSSPYGTWWLWWPTLQSGSDTGRLKNSLRNRAGKDHRYISNQPEGFQVNQAEAATLRAGKSTLGFASSASSRVLFNRFSRTCGVKPYNHLAAQKKRRQSLRETTLQIIFYPGGQLSPV